jgi:hypothetical protein
VRATVSISWDRSIPSARRARGPRQNEHPARAGADVEQVADVRFREKRKEHSFDLGILDMQRPQPIPAFGIFAEVLGGGLGALFLHHA